MTEDRYDAIIIGAGVIGCSIARELSRRQGKFAVVERGEDVCSGTSKANSGIVHAGFDAKPGTKMAYYNVQGARLMPALSKELDFSFRQNGAMVVSFSKDDLPRLQLLYRQGVINNVVGLRIWPKEQARRLEPGLSPDIKEVLFAPTSGIVCPFEMTIAMAENAAVNGVTFYLGREVTSITKSEGGYRICTSQGVMETRAVVNAAGVYADWVHNQVCQEKLSITARRGEYCLFDKAAGNVVTRTIFQMPTEKGKGILVTPTVHGNLMAGPTALDIEEKEGTNTTQDGLAEVLEKARKSVPSLPTSTVITSFAGLRAVEAGNDFVLGEAKGAPGFFDAAGICSPGLSSAPAIGRDVAKWVADYLDAPDNPDFCGERKGIRHFASLSREEQAALAAENPAYGRIICRCEQVTEGELLDAIHRPLGARSMDGLKRRTRAGMGRCQAGFCTPKAAQILARETGQDLLQIRKAEPGSELLRGMREEVKE